jgi:hypothetical protein
MNDYAVVAAGLVIGIMARWAKVLSLGESLTKRAVVTDILILAMNGLIAAQIGEIAGIHGLKLAIEAAMLGASSTTVFAQIHAGWLKSPGIAIVFSGSGETLSVPPSPGPVKVTSIGFDSPQTTAEVVLVTLAHISPPSDDAGFEEYLDRIG